MGHSSSSTSSGLGWAFISSLKAPYVRLLRKLIGSTSWRMLFWKRFCVNRFFFLFKLLPSLRFVVCLNFTEICLPLFSCQEEGGKEKKVKLGVLCFRFCFEVWLSGVLPFILSFVGSPMNVYLCFINFNFYLFLATKVTFLSFNKLQSVFTVMFLLSIFWLYNDHKILK